MNKPTSISHAVLAIWATMGICILSAIAGRATGQISSNNFIGTLITYGLFAILPYKMGLGRNWARYFYTVITAIGYAMIFAGETAGMSQIDKVLSWILLPVEGWIIFLLFKPESREWFEQTQ